jgi:Bacterial regulatory proteins, gntR family
MSATRQQLEQSPTGTTKSRTRYPARARCVRTEPRVRVKPRRIAAGEWASGDALPTVDELAEHYATSGATVSKVLRRLADDGLVTVVPSWGTFRA